VAELALDHHEWDAFVGEFDRVRVSQLVRSEAAADAAVSRNWARAAALDHAGRASARR
jgi:hypothetical protein